MATAGKGRQGYIVADMSLQEFLSWGVGQGRGSDDEGSSLESKGERPTTSYPQAPWHMDELPAMICKSCVGEKSQNSAKVRNAGNLLGSHLETQAATQYVGHHSSPTW